MAAVGVQVNLVLMVLNLVPLPPLDGGRIVYSLLPQPYANQYARIEPYGMLILIVLMFTGCAMGYFAALLAFGNGIIRLFL